MSRKYVNCVFHLYTFKHLMCGVCYDAIDWAHKPLSQVHTMGQSILNRTSPGGTISVVDFPVCRAVCWNMLARNADELYGSAETTL